jgi:repressor LexA
MLNKERLIKLREQKGFTQESIASELNIFQESYARWESGAIKYPRMKTLQQLADTLGTTIEYLTDSEILPIFQKLDEQDKKLTVSFAENLLNKKDDK